MLSLCLHLSSLYLCHLITAVVVIIYGLDFFIDFFSLFSYSTHTLFNNKLELVICNLGVLTFKVFYTLFEHSIGIGAGALAVV